MCLYFKGQNLGNIQFHGLCLSSMMIIVSVIVCEYRAMLVNGNSDKK